MRWLSPAPARDPTTAGVEVPAPAHAAAAIAAYSRGVEYFRRGEFELAAQAFKQALELKHNLAEAHFYLGLISRKQSQLEDASDRLLLATAFKPDFAEAWFYLGVVDLGCKRYDAARRNFETALRLKPDYAEAHNSYAKLCEELEQIGDAIAHIRTALQLKPDFALAYCNLARLTLRDSLDADAALHYARTAVSLRPQLAEAHSCLAQILQFQCRCEEAVAECGIALELDPAASHTRMIRALAALMLGDFAAGWRDYEERKKVYPIYAVRKFPYPEWNGTPLSGRRLLVYHEQGLGDEIMFASCLPDLLALGGHCIVECSSKLEPLFRRSFPAATVIAADQTSPDMSYLNALPRCDWQVAAGSLPRYFRRHRDDFPRSAGYLVAAADRIDHWRARLQRLGPASKVGLSWRGGALHTNQPNRSIDLERLAPLLKMPGCEFVSLQYGDCRAELDGLHERLGVRVQHWAEAIEDYAETAALVSALDLIITVDTSAAHLSGALGRPTWVLVPANAEWRYMVTGDRMPWYPTMRLFRRAHGAGWEPVIERVAAELAGIARRT
jgi:tetratricopeptide (TPR) repeat protein